MAKHDFIFISSHGEDAPGKSLDTYSYCPKCGTVKRDYAHNGGQTSPNYPMFVSVGYSSWRAVEPECKEFDTACPACGGEGGDCSECGGSGWRAT